MATNNNDEREYFDGAQKTERQCIKELFKNYFKPHNCHSLTFTSTEDDEEYPSHYDAHLFSAITTSIIVEFKKRNIVKSTDTMIEFKKYIELYDYYRAGHTVYYIIQFDDYIFLWNLSKIYENEKDIPLDHYFRVQKCTKSMFNYVKGEEDNLIRDLQFNQADLIIDHNNNYKVISYQEYITKKLALYENRPKPIAKKIYTIDDADKLKNKIRDLQEYEKYLIKNNLEDVKGLLNEMYKAINNTPVTDNLIPNRVVNEDSKERT